MGRGRGAFSAIARNFSGDVVGATFGGKKCGHPLEIQVYSIFVALQLAERLKNEGKHDGPVTIETHHALARAMVLGTDTDGLEIDSCEIDDDDDETVPAGFAEAVGAGGDWCTTLTEEEEIAEKLPQDVKDILEKDKLMAGNILLLLFYQKFSHRVHNIFYLGVSCYGFLLIKRNACYTYLNRIIDCCILFFMFVTSNFFL